MAATLTAHTDTPNQPARPLCSALRARINRLAHRQGLIFEAAQKAAMLSVLQTARDAGASLDELIALIDKLEADNTV